jgi:hypothetical protein
VQYFLINVEKDGDRVMEAIGKDKLWEISNRVNEEVTLTGIQFEDLFKDVTGRTPQEYRPKEWGSQ